MIDKDNLSLLRKTLKELQNRVYAIVGVYFDATTGFVSNINKIQELQKQQTTEISDEYLLQRKLDELDSVWIIYGEGDPNTSDAKSFHISTRKEYKKRNSKDGLNYKFLGNMCLVIIYQYWEDSFRGKIAEITNTRKDNILSDLFGDLRLLRRSIIHHNSIALKEVENCKLLKWFKESDEIFIDQKKLLEILSNVSNLKLLIKDSPQKR